MTFHGEDLLQAHNVRVEGDGEEVVVLAHGFGCDQSTWDFLLPSLVARYKVVLLDMPYAPTAQLGDFHPAIYQSFHELADDILRVLQALCIHSCSYVGHSMAAMVGCIAATKKPKLFNKLVLLCASPRYLNDSGYHGGFEREDLEKMYSSMKSDFQAWVSSFAKLAVGVEEDDAHVRQFGCSFMKMRREIAMVVAETIFESDLRGILPQVKTSCCIIQTMRDIAVPLEVAHYLRCNLGGNATLEIMESEGHLPQLTAPHVLAPVLDRALSS